MKITRLTSAFPRMWLVRVSLATTVGCASLLPNATITVSIAAPPTSIASRPIQTIRQEPSQIDGQTSWVIEPDVPRVPRIEGVEFQLPPHIEQRLGRAFDLAQRGATYSANTEFREVLALCALELDARDRTTAHRDALRQALIALDEADEISGHRIDWTDPADVRLATAGHSTPVLQGGVPTGVDAVQVAQLYYSFAEERFAYACEGVPAASMAYYGLARTFVQPGTRYKHAAGKAAVLQRVALRITPRNMLAANELGVLLAQHGHLNEAEALFKQCVATDATPEAYQNLAAVYARKGDKESSQAALIAGSKLAAARQKATRPVVADANESAVAANATSVEPVATDQDQAITMSEEDTEPKAAPPGFWEKLQLSQKIPQVFRR